VDCLIIAAGFGSRLRTVSPSKPLTPVAGMPLIERVIRAAADGGATRFVVATGHEADRLEVFLGTLPFAIEPVRVADWDLPNGHSVLAGAARIRGDYLLTMSDHLFDPAIMAALIAAPPAALILAVDRDLANPLLDMDDVTKVETDEAGAIVRIGKALTRFDAADTGLFRATPALADAIAAGGGSLSDGVQRLASQGAAVTLDVTGHFWLDVDDPAALAKAEAAFARD
jgi:1L-myo-inositol 1-phosphate cytidylyltransferase